MIALAGPAAVDLLDADEPEDLKVLGATQVGMGKV